MEKKGQVNVGLINAIVFGIAGLIIVTIIAFVLIATMLDSNLLTTSTVNVVNETPAFLNSTTYTLSNLTGVIGNPRGFSIDEIWNATIPVNVIVSDNYTLDSTTAVLENATATTFSNITVSYSYIVDDIEGTSAKKMRDNFTSGIDNISSKLPTVLLIAAIVLILSVLAILVIVWQRMRIGGGSL